MGQCGAGIHADPEQSGKHTESTRAMLVWLFSQQG